MKVQRRVTIMTGSLGSLDHHKTLGRTFAPMLLALLLLLFFVMESIHQEETVSEGSIKRIVFSKKNSCAFARKLLQSTGIGSVFNLCSVTLQSLHYDINYDKGDGNRIGTTCTKDDIMIFQGPTAPLPNGIPTFTVQILNACVSGCSLSNIHVSCGWFSSVRLINPTIFRRLYYDDCLVNDGQPLGAGQCLSFQYSNSFSYPLSVSSVDTC